MFIIVLDQAYAALPKSGRPNMYVYIYMYVYTCVCKLCITQ